MIEFFKLKYFLVQLVHSDGTKEYGGFAAGKPEAFWTCQYSSLVRSGTKVNIKEVTKDRFLKAGLTFCRLGLVLKVLPRTCCSLLAFL